jgi:hypothetical protein
VPWRRGRHAGRWWTGAAVAECGLHARRPPAVSAARRRHALVVEQVSDGLETFAGVAERLDTLDQLGGTMREPRTAPPRPARSRLMVPALDLAQHPSGMGAGSCRGVQPKVKRDEIAVSGVQPVEHRDQFPQRAGRVREASHKQRGRLPSADALQSSHEVIAHDPDHVNADPRTVGAGVGLYAHRVVREGGTVHTSILRKYIA